MELIDKDQDTSVAFVNLSLEETTSISSCSLNLEESSNDLKVSLEMLLKEATGFADFWNDVSTKISGRRSFPSFLSLIQDSEMDWHYIASEDNELTFSNHPTKQSLHALPSYPNLTSDSNWVMANNYYDRSLTLMKLLRRIHSESSSDFSREQAGLLASFLDHLITIQKEQRVVAYGFFEHLERLRKSVAASLLSLEVAELKNLSGDISSSLGAANTKATEETLELIEQAVQKLSSVRFSNLTGGGSPLENITHWRVLIESSLVNLGLDVIFKKHDEAIKLWVSTHSLNRLHGMISSLLSAADTLLLDYVAMHRTAEEITYMLGDAFTTGGAGMNDLNDETRSIEIDIDMDFPWDKHTVPDAIKYDFSNPDTWSLVANPSFAGCPVSNDEFN